MRCCERRQGRRFQTTDAAVVESQPRYGNVLLFIFLFRLPGYWVRVSLADGVGCGTRRSYSGHGSFSTYSLNFVGTLVCCCLFRTLVGEVIAMRSPSLLVPRFRGGAELLSVVRPQVLVVTAVPLPSSLRRGSSPSMNEGPCTTDSITHQLNRTLN